MTFRLITGDCVEAMQAMAENSVDAIVTDPPYGLEFMGKEWDRFDGEKAWRRRVKDESDDPEKDWGVFNRTSKNAPHLYVAGAAAQEWHHAWATEALRVLKPGGHLLAFGGTRTYHRLACAIEDAGFEIRDCLAWMYGSGFPKSLDVSKAIDKAARGVPQGAANPTSPHHGKYRTQRTEGQRGDGDNGQGYGAGPGQFMLGEDAQGDHEGTVDFGMKNRCGKCGLPFFSANPCKCPKAAAVTSEAQRWAGYGTALKPSHEPIVMARKPLSEKNVAANVLRWGTGALNIDGTRIDYQGEDDTPTQDEWNRMGSSGAAGANGFAGQFSQGMKDAYADGKIPVPSGRWPANVVLGHSPDCEQTGETRKVKASRPASGPTLGQLGANGIYGEAKGDGRAPANYADEDGLESVPVWNCAPGCAVAMLDEQTGESISRKGKPGRAGTPGEGWGIGTAVGAEYDDQGGASRFFYCAKADREERNRGVEHLSPKALNWSSGEQSPGTFQAEGTNRSAANNHPTVKPVELMRWLCRLVTPKGGTVLDPFTGSGSTGVAAMREGFEFIGIEREAAYVEIARGRIYGDAPMFNIEVEV